MANSPWFRDLPLDFSRADTRAAESLLVAAYGNPFAAVALAQNAGLSLAALNTSAPTKFLIRDMMQKARVADRLLVLLADVFRDGEAQAVHGQLGVLLRGHEGELAASALTDQPSLETISALPLTIGVWAGTDKEPRTAASTGFERTLNAAAGFADPTTFRRRLAEAEVRTARIDINGKAAGTGFLVSASLLLTNWHVVQDGAAAAVARFDHGWAGTGRAVRFAESWLVAKSEHASSAVELSVAGPEQECWDFAVTRLAAPVGAQPIGPDPIAAAADVRGHFQIDGGAYGFDSQEPIFIVGHPKGWPVSFSYASPSGVRCVPSGYRLRYQTNSEPGSSGSPVFNKDWRVVGLHQASGPATTTEEFVVDQANFNQGVPMSGIAAELRRQLVGSPVLAELGLE